MKKLPPIKTFSQISLLILTLVSVPHLAAMPGQASCATVVSAIAKPTPFKLVRDFMLPFARDRKSWRMNALSIKPSRLIFSDFYNGGPESLAKLLKNTNWEKTTYSSNDLMLLFANNLADFSYIMNYRNEHEKALVGLQSFIKKMMDTADSDSATRLWSFVEQEMSASQERKENFLNSSAMRLMYDVLFDLEVKTKGVFEGPLAQSLHAIPQFSSHIAGINDLGLPLSEKEGSVLDFNQEARKGFAKIYFHKNNKLHFSHALELALEGGDRKELYNLMKSNGVGARTMHGLGVDYFLQGTVVHNLIGPEAEALDKVFEAKSNESFVVRLLGYVFERRIVVALEYPYIPSGRSLREFPLEPMLTQGVQYIELILRTLQKGSSSFDQSKINLAIHRLVSGLDDQRHEVVASRLQESERDPEKKQAQDFLGAFGIELVDKTPIDLASILVEFPEASAFLNALMDKDVEAAKRLVEAK